MTQVTAENFDDLAEVQRYLDEAVQHLVTEDDTPVDNLFSEKQQRLLTESLYSSWTPPSTAASPKTKRPFLAAANVGVFASLHQPPLVPDVFLSLDVTVPEDWYEKGKRSYFLWEFGKAPEAVIEIVSNRKGRELSDKRHDYARMGVLYYVVYDPLRQLSDEVLQVFESQVGVLQPRNDFYLPSIGLGLTLWNGRYEDKESTWLRWCDEHGVVIMTGAERAAQEAKRATREAKRADREAKRAARLAAKLREMGIDPEEL